MTSQDDSKNAGVNSLVENPQETGVSKPSEGSDTSGTFEARIENAQDCSESAQKNGLSHPSNLSSSPCSTGTFESSEARPLVIILHASVGSGHRSAAQAVAQAMETLRGQHENLPANTEISVLDILDFGGVRFSGEKTASIFTGVLSPVYDITWHHIFTGRILWGGAWGWSPAMYWKFTRLVKQRKPIAIIATHIVAANCAVAARMSTGQTFPVACVPTDYGVEGLWPHLYADLFCAADDFMIKELLPRRVPREKIAVTGIPVRAGFEDDHDVVAIRDRFGLPQDKKIVLVMAGAKYSEPYLPFRRIIEPAFGELSNLIDMHFAFLAGEDVEYATYLKQTFKERGIENVSVFNYVEDMVDLMSASDLIVAKSGGLAVTECVCARLPILLVGKSYGQERANTYTVTRVGAALKAETTKEFIRQIKRIHQKPYILDLMKEKGKTIRRPNSAFDVAVATLDLVGTIEPLKKPFLKIYIGGKPVHVR